MHGSQTPDFEKGGGELYELELIELLERWENRELLKVELLRAEQLGVDSSSSISVHRTYDEGIERTVLFRAKHFQAVGRLFQISLNEEETVLDGRRSLRASEFLVSQDAQQITWVDFAAVFRQPGNGRWGFSEFSGPYLQVRNGKLTQSRGKQNRPLLPELNYRPSYQRLREEDQARNRLTRILSGLGQSTLVEIN